MADEAHPYVHGPVMVEEISKIFAEVPTGLFVDATVGGGGHSEAVLEENPGLSVIGIDQDPDALEASSVRLARFEGRVTLRRARFDSIALVVEAGRSELRDRAPVDGEPGDLAITGALFDLGVSSPQLDVGARGFSYRNDGPLDMRMDTDAALTAADVVNTYEERELVRVLHEFADERFAARIAKAIVTSRPIRSTVQLAAVARDAIPAGARRSGGHPAKRTFQAIRIEVNSELEILGGAIDAAIDLLAPKGRVAVLSYHSGEDRIVKARLRVAETGGCVCPQGLPCVCGAVPKVRLLRRGGWTPKPEEIERNPRAESARLRAAERLEVAA